MDLYYLCYKESVDELCARIDADLLLRDIWYNADYGNDIYLVHAIYYTAKEMPRFCKKDIREKIWAKISPRCKIDKEKYSGRTYEDFKRGFERLFDYCWKVKFSVEETEDVKKTRELSKAVYNSMGLKHKLYNSNGAILTFAILFIALQVWINDAFEVLEFVETHEFIIPIVVLLTSVYVSAGAGKAYSLPVIGIIVMAGLLIQDLWGETASVYAVALVKRDLLWIATYLLWYPVIILNYDRLKDINYISG